MSLMCVGNSVEMLRSQYLAGFKEERISSYPTVPRINVNCEATIDGTIDDVAKINPALTPCLYNDVKVCNRCGKPCAFTIVVCNSCGNSLADVPITKSENVFSAFLFGVKSASKGFPYIISLRRETDDVLIFDDMLQLSTCHFNGISKKYYIPDWRYLLLAPQKGLELLDTLEAELWAATGPFLQDAAYRKAIHRSDFSNEDVRQSVISCFNFPPSQFQLHVQWMVPPLVPFQHFMAEMRNHFHEGRCFPVSYVRKVLSLNEPFNVKKDTPIERIIEFYRGKGVDYTSEWTTWYESVCLKNTLSYQNWNPDDFEYVVQDGKVHKFSVEGGKVHLGEELTDLSPSAIQAKDKAILQNYGRPYSEAGKPSGTYIQKPLQPKVGDGGYQLWHGLKLEDLS
eukprot:TRINITY_DN17927_c0_g1_i1.p1 TRINITY_DN17927_c0_g1~~TRINITY_DN17927_c0_g1_i1.p1  ORF type:complete len:397 (-),score=54.14 TRINITY_DN17927_c0_g1_i1:350-1540(-)